MKKDKSSEWMERPQTPLKPSKPSEDTVLPEGDFEGDLVDPNPPVDKERKKDPTEGNLIEPEQLKPDTKKQQG